MVLAVAQYLNVSDNEDINKINHSITPVLVNSVAKSGNMKLLQKLHKEGADLDAVDYLGRSVLHVVANANETPELIDIMRYLVKNQINLDLLDNKARSALYLAIDAKNNEIARILSEAGASVVADDERMAKILCTIGYENDLAKLRFLVKCEVDLETADYDKRTIGHLAAAEGNIDILEYLITSSNLHFNFNLEDRWGRKVLDELRDLAKRAKMDDLISRRDRKWEERAKDR